MTLKRFNSKDRAKAVQLLHEGVPPKEIAQQFGVSVSTVYNVRNERGLGRSKKDRATRLVQFRLSEDEYQALQVFIADTGAASPSAAMRGLVRAATGYLELRRDEFLNLEAVLSELKAQGRNLNQLSRAMNRAALMSRAELSSADKEFLAEVRTAFVGLHSMVKDAFREVRQKGRNALHTADRL